MDPRDPCKEGWVKGHIFSGFFCILPLKKLSLIYSFRTLQMLNIWSAPKNYVQWNCVFNCTALALEAHRISTEGSVDSLRLAQREYSLFHFHCNTLEAQWVIPQNPAAGNFCYHTSRFQVSGTLFQGKLRFSFTRIYIFLSLSQFLTQEACTEQEPCPPRGEPSLCPQSPPHSTYPPQPPSWNRIWKKSLIKLLQREETYNQIGPEECSTWKHPF